MSRSPEGSDSDLLFDLPLDSTAGERSPGLSLDEDQKGMQQVALDFPSEDPPEAVGPARIEAPVAARFTASLLDLVVLAAILGFALLALSLFEISVGRRDLAPLGLFLASFSFLYHVMPLAFWGHTPGMAFAGIHSRSRSNDYMTIQQCMARWLGWVLTLASGGLLALLALSGVSLTDLVSRTRTFVRAKS